MTFCMAFSANPDGIALISDTRITRANYFEDGFQKIIFPTRNSVVAVAGGVGICRFVLQGVSGFLEGKLPHDRLDELRKQLRERFKDYVRDGKAQGPEDSASIIYGDLRPEKGPTRCRLIRFDLALSDSGEPIFTEQTGANFSTQEVKKFPEDKHAIELPWLCIGTIPGTRNLIGNTAMEQVHQYLASGLKISTDLDKGAVKARGRVYQAVSVRGASKPYRGTTAVHFTMDGPSDGSFRKKLRWFANEKERMGEQTPFGVIDILGLAALKRIELLMTEIPGPIGLETVSDTWSLATISRTGGLRLVTGDDPNGVTLSFGLRRELS